MVQANLKTPLCVAAAVVRPPQMLMGNLIRSSTPHPRPSFQGNASTKMPTSSSAGSASSRAARPASLSAGPTPTASASMGSGSLSEQRARQRKELLAHCSNFLNPDNKPGNMKKEEVKSQAASQQQLPSPKAEEKETNNNDKKWARPLGFYVPPLLCTGCDLILPDHSVVLIGS